MTHDPFAHATWRLIEWHNDGGHGWLRVPLELVADISGISAYSYRDNEFAYLEEDCDAARFIHHGRNEETLCRIFGSRIIEDGPDEGNEHATIPAIWDGTHSFIRKLTRFY